MILGGPSVPRPCRDEGCDVNVILARHAQTGRWAAYEAQDRPPFSEQAAGCRVIVNNQAWAPRDLVEDFQVRLELSEDKARELVTGYPFHRLHHHDRAEGSQ